MSSATLIQRLLKLLRQVLTALATSSAQRLGILVSCFRRFVAKVHVSISHNSDSRSCTADSCCTVVTGAPSAPCLQCTLPLPLYNQQTTSPSAASGAQHGVLSSTPPGTMPTPCIPQHASPPRTSSPTPVGNAIPSNSSAITPRFVPFGHSRGPSPTNHVRG
ncbi:hypothetical protein DFH29DRAFT_39499 [Suillus ampliporus]|nr:hypothetical protein DFH29DRAFT_39499 [Suillus ampliporus]